MGVRRRIGGFFIVGKIVRNSCAQIFCFVMNFLYRKHPGSSFLNSDNKNKGILTLILIIKVLLVPLSEDIGYRSDRVFQIRSLIYNRKSTYEIWMVSSTEYLLSKLIFIFCFSQLFYSNKECRKMSITLTLISCIWNLKTSLFLISGL